MIIEKLGLAVAEAQRALDENSIQIAQSMADTEVTVAGGQYNLLALGFMPSFYAFTEATVESKMSFTMMEEKSFSVGGSVGVNVGVFAASVDISYARKFSVEAEGASSIAARMVSLPPPETLMRLLKDLPVIQ